MKEIYQQFRNEQNALVSVIRELKANRKETRGYTGEFYMTRGEYRHRHIALSELRGRSRDEIENPRECNLPKERLIKKYKDEYTKRINKAAEEITDEAVSLSA